MAYITHDVCIKLLKEVQRAKSPYFFLHDCIEDNDYYSFNFVTAPIGYKCN